MRTCAPRCRQDVDMAADRKRKPHPVGSRLDGLSAAEVVHRIDELLELTYQSADLGNVSDVLDEAIYILLSLQTRELVYQQVYTQLKERFPTWIAVLDAPASEVAKVLKPAGFQRQRATKLIDLLSRIAEENDRRDVGPARGGDLTLDFLREARPEEAERFLMSLPGVGTKSARCISLYSLGHDTFPVDTHVARVFDRLALVKLESWKPVHDAYQELVPERLRRRLHINLVHHGRAVCRSERPRCESCVLVSFCRPGRERISATGPTAVDLFGGAGGLGEGFARAGFQIAAAVEQDTNAAQTYRANHPGVPVLEADVAGLDADDVKTFAPAARRCDVVIAGPPCQGFSAAGPRDPTAERNFLYRHVVRLARDLKARAVVIENVPGTARVNGVGFTQTILGSIRRAGFAAADFLTDGVAFGVPQRRKRVFFVGLRRDLGRSPSPPEPTFRSPGTIDDGTPETPTLTELLKQLPDRAHGVLDDRLALPDGTVVHNVATMSHSPRVVEKISQIAPGQGPISYRRLESDVARTIIAGHRALPVHPWLDRTISVREAALIQGFPLTYVFCGPRAEQPLQVANAVPPPLAEAVGTHLMKLLD